MVRTVKEFVDDEMSTYASALAYQMLFSLFPFILFLIALIGFLHLPDFFTWLRLQSELVLPPQALEQVNPVIDQLQQSKGGLLGGYRDRPVDGLGRRAPDDERDERRLRRGRRPADLEALSAVDFLHRRHRRHAAGRRRADGARAASDGAGSPAQSAGGFHRHALDHRALAGDRDSDDGRRGADLLRDARRQTGIPLHHPRLGAGGGGVDHRVLGFFYVKTFADYNAMYGSIGAIIVLLLYFYISSAVLLLGAEMNAVIEHMSKARTRAKSPRRTRPGIEPKHHVSGLGRDHSLKPTTDEA
jgi:hypothetical protein